MTMKNKKTQGHHMWTKEEIKKLYTLWDEKSVEELAEEIGVEPGQIRTMAIAMRKEGFKLVIKRKNGHVRLLLKEVKEELGM